MVRFLIADDHELIRRGMRALVETRGDVEVREARNGMEAVELSKEMEFDLVILDISMPVCDGFAAAREIRKIQSKTPILFVSLARTELFVEVARKIGVNGFLTKTENSETLLKAVDSALHGNFFPSL